MSRKEKNDDGEERCEMVAMRKGKIGCVRESQTARFGKF